MIITSTDLTGEQTLEASICIVGAGAAGIALACELDGRDVKVLLLESGGLKSDPSLTDDYRGTANAPHADPTQFRRAAFGGTTSLWGGRCVPLDPIDFERRDYIPHSGWPIAYEEVARHYPRALTYCDAGRFDFTASGSIPRYQPTIPGLAAGDILLDDCIERYSLPTDFGKRYRMRLERSTNIEVVLNARCVRIAKGPGEDRIESIEFVDGAGRRRQARAQSFVLATGGIETARLMLASEPAVGLGNRYDLLGRYYSCHFENTYGRLVPRGRAVVFDFEKTTDGVYCRRQMRFSAPAQREHRLLNTAFRLHFPAYSDAAHGSSAMSLIYLAKSLLVPEYRAILQHSSPDAVHSPPAQHVLNVMTGLPQLAKFSYDYVFRILLAERKLPYTLVANADGSYPLEFNCEQTPLESNRISLTNDVDRHGLRRVRVEWKIAADDVEAACRAFLLLKSVINASGACRLEFDEARLRDKMATSLPLGGHHIGTARMAATEREGIVDEQCAVFGLTNLFIASSAVFPTSSHANPTLTIVALSIRLAEHLLRRVT